MNMENEFDNQSHNGEFTDLEEQLLLNADKFDELYFKTNDLKAKIKYNSGNFYIFGVPVVCAVTNYVATSLLEKYGPEKVKTYLNLISNFVSEYNLNITELLTLSEMCTIVPIFFLIGMAKNIMKIKDKRYLENSKKLLEEMKKNNKDLVAKIKLSNATEISFNDIESQVEEDNNPVLKLKK